MNFPLDKLCRLLPALLKKKCRILAIIPTKWFSGNLERITENRKQWGTSKTPLCLQYSSVCCCLFGGVGGQGEKPVQIWSFLQDSDSLLTGAIPWVSYRGYTLGWGTEGYRGAPFLCFHSSVSENGTLLSGELASIYVHLTGEMQSQCWIVFQCSSRWGLSVSFLQACGVWPAAETFKVMAMGQYISQMISQSTSQRICPLLRQACPETSPGLENLSWLQSCQEKEPDLQQGPWYALGAGELLGDNTNLTSKAA